nr:hypothetical protein [Thiobaca trueperi]
MPTGCSRDMAGRVLKSLEEQGLVSIKLFGARSIKPTQ